MNTDSHNLWLHLMLLQLLQQNQTDPLTGLLNRRGFNETLQQLHAAAQRYQRPLSLVLIDVQNLKATNNQHGHPAGDQRLQQLAQTLQQHKRTSDYAARIGGDEFALLLPETNKAQAQQAMQRMQQQLNRQEIAIHIGIATHPSPDLYAEADRQLKKRKENT